LTFYYKILTEPSICTPAKYQTKYHLQFTYGYRKKDVEKADEKDNYNSNIDTITKDEFFEHIKKI